MNQLTNTVIIPDWSLCCDEDSLLGRIVFLGSAAEKLGEAKCNLGNGVSCSPPQVMEATQAYSSLCNLDMSLSAMQVCTRWSSGPAQLRAGSRGPSTWSASSGGGARRWSSLPESVPRPWGFPPSPGLLWQPVCPQKQVRAYGRCQTVHGIDSIHIPTARLQNRGRWWLCTVACPDLSNS